MSEEKRRGPPKPSPEKEPRVPKERKASAPTSRVKSSGRLNRRLEQLETLFKRENPGHSVHWVYDPKHKPDLSNILSRQVDGYELVKVKDLGEAMALPGMKPDEPVRVGDTVMMSIAEDIVKEIRADLDERARDELSRVEQEYQQAVDEIVTRKGGKEYRARPMGVSKTEAVEAEVEVPATHSE